MKTKEEILEEELQIANSLLRSAYSIAERGGQNTQWDSFLKQTKEALERQHRIMYPKTCDHQFKCITDTDEWGCYECVKCGYRKIKNYKRRNQGESGKPEPVEKPKDTKLLVAEALLRQIEKNDKLTELIAELKAEIERLKALPHKPTNSQPNNQGE